MYLIPLQWWYSLFLTSFPFLAWMAFILWSLICCCSCSVYIISCVFCCCFQSCCWIILPFSCWSCHCFFLVAAVSPHVVAEIGGALEQYLPCCPICYFSCCCCISSSYFRRNYCLFCWYKTFVPISVLFATFLVPFSSLLYCIPSSAGLLSNYVLSSNIIY